MANNVTIPAQGTGDTTPKVSTDQVSADNHQVQNVQLASVAGGVLTRNPTIAVSNAGTFAVQADTELPTAAALGDTDANPTTTQVGSMLQGWTGSVWQRLKSGPNSDGIGANGFLNVLAMLFNGTTYDRIRGDAANGVDVDVTRVTGTVTVAGAVTNAGTFAVQDSQVITDNAAFTDGTSKVFPNGYIFDEVAGTALTENDAAAARIDSKRAQVYVQEDATTRGQRQAVSAAGAASSNLTQVAGATVAQGHGTAATALRVELPTDGTGTVVLAAGAASIGSLAANQSVNQAQVAGTAVDVNSGNKSAGTQRVVIATDQPNLTTPLNNNVAQINGVTPLMGTGNTGTGSLRVTIATDQVQLTNALKVDPSAVTSPVSLATPTSGGYSISRLLSAASTNATSVKGSAGQVYGWYLANAAAYTVFFKIYNKASAPTVGSDTPVLTIPIPAGSAANVEFMRGIALGTGIGFAITKLVADADTTAVVANDLVVNLLYA